MAKLIFSTKSYLVLFKLDKAQQDASLSWGDRAGFRVILDQTLEELQTSLSKVQKMVAVLVNGRAMDQAELASTLEALKAAGVAYLVLGDGNQSTLRWDGTTPHFVNILRAYLNSLTPKKMLDIALSTANFVQPMIMPEVPLDLSKKSSDSGDHDTLITCDTFAETWQGRLHVRLNFQGMREKSDACALLTDSQLSDRTREFSNQFLGIINSFVMQQGVRAKISLPTEIRLSGNTKIAPSQFMPSVSFGDSTGAFICEFFSLNTAESEGVNFSTIVPEFPDGTAEFL